MGIQGHKFIWIILLGGKAVSSQTGQIRGVMCQRPLYPTQNPNLSSFLPHLVPQSIWCSLSSYSSPTLNAIFSPKSLIFVFLGCTRKLYCKIKPKLYMSSHALRTTNMENLIYRGFIDVLVIIVVTIHVNFREAYLAIPKFGSFIYIHL